ncbi:purine-nucleoside phosphorylase [candidate division KSB1 bacterium]|nr:purine-nucleoside phosphorylase [candidate division KSB1 bacterium]
MDLKEQIIKAAAFVSDREQRRFDLGIVLGTGLGSLADEIEQATLIPYADIPYFPESTVKFHAGRLVMGLLEGKTVFAMQGRFHAYEGYPLRQITLPIRLMYQLGIRRLLLTNAVGSIKPHLQAGTIALVKDHLNLMGSNPLIGPYDPFYGERFPDMSEPYSNKLRDLAQRVAVGLDIDLPEVVYAAVTGPSYETAAEVRMLNILGADTVGMSVVPETLVARQLDMEVLALNAITDQLLPEAMNAVSHEEVNKVAAVMSPVFIRLLRNIIRAL